MSSSCSYKIHIASAGGTVPYYSTSYDPEKDCIDLQKAMKGLGTDEITIIEILGKRSHHQRMEMAKKYPVLFGKDLKDHLESDTSGNFRKTLKALVTDRPLFEAKCIHRAIKGLGTNESILIEFLATRSNVEISLINEAYQQHYKKRLEEDIRGDTSGDFKKLLVSLCQGARDESNTVDSAKAVADAKELHEAGEKRWGTDEAVFNKILVSRSYPQLRATFEEYERIASRDIVSTIKREMSGDVEDGMIAIVEAVQNKPAFFARKLYKTMKGLGTDDDGLIRIIVTCEYDIVEIKREFERLYKKSLKEFIRDDTSGDYRKLLLTLIGEN